MIDDGVALNYARKHDNPEVANAGSTGPLVRADKAGRRPRRKYMGSGSSLDQQLGPCAALVAQEVNSKWLLSALRRFNFHFTQWRHVGELARRYYSNRVMLDHAINGFAARLDFSLHNQTGAS